MRYAIAFVFLFLSACGAFRSAASEARDAVVDCTTKEAGKLIAEFAPTVEVAIANARTAAGEIDYDQALDRLRSFGKSSGACVLADLVAAAMSGRRSATGFELKADESRILFDHVRDRLWPGVKFKTEAGAL